MPDRPTATFFPGTREMGIDAGDVPCTGQAGAPAGRRGRSGARRMTIAFEGGSTHAIAGRGLAKAVMRVLLGMIVI